MKKFKFFNQFMKKFVFTVSLSLLMFISAPSNAKNYSIDDQTNIKVYEIVSPSIVSIDVDILEGISSGTGCVVDPTGIILTSSHVIEGFKDIKITLPDGKSYTGEIVADNHDSSDFTLIKIKVEKPLKIIKLGDSSKVRVGQKVLAIGNPFGFNRTLTTGIISRVDQKRDKIQTDAAINPGSSGGPLLNIDGEVIGINQSIYNPDNNKSNIGIGFAVPVNIAKDFIDQVKKNNPSLFKYSQ